MYNGQHDGGDGHHSTTLKGKEDHGVWEEEGEGGPH